MRATLFLALALLAARAIAAPDVPAADARNASLLAFKREQIALLQGRH